MTAQPNHEAAPPPLLRVVRGRPEPQEIAAVTAVLVALLSAGEGGPGGAAGPRRSAWGHPAVAVRRPTPRSWRGAR